MPVRLKMSNTSTGLNTMSSTASASASKPAAAKKVAKKESVASPSASVPAVTASVSAPASAPAPAPAKKVAKKEAVAASTTAAPAPSAPVVNAVIAEAPSASAIASTSATAAEAPATTVSQDIEALVLQLQNVRDAAVSGLKALARLSKRVQRDIKEAGRRRRRNRVAPAEGSAPVVKRPTIFTTPVTLKDELAHFLGQAKGHQMTPADVTRAFSAYVDAHKLKDAEKGHTIHHDAAMRKVLGVKEGEALTYRNIQTYLYKLYVLPEKKATASASASTSA